MVARFLPVWRRDRRCRR